MPAAKAGIKFFELTTAVLQPGNVAGRFHLVRVAALSLALIAVSVSLPACGTKHSQIRFVHVCPDVQNSNGTPANVDVLFDGGRFATNLALLSYTNYQTVKSGDQGIEVRYTGTTTDLVDAPNVNFFGHAQYTIFFTGLTQPPSGSANQTINPVNDDNTAPSSGNIKLRFFHGSPCAGDPQCLNPESFDIYVVAPGTDISNIAPSVASLAYQQVTNYVSTAAGSYEIILTPSGSKTRALDETPSGFTAGQIRTLAAVDQAGAFMLSPTLLELADLN